MTKAGSHPDDPRALIAEALRMEGLTEPDARSIFFDWALGLPDGEPAGPAAQRLLAHHNPAEDHPIAGLLRAATAEASGGPRRRGGRKSRT